MKKRILSYLEKVNQLLEEDGENTDWNMVLEEHLIQVSYFQHERFIHLIVMVLVALMATMDLLALVISFHISLVILMIPLLILLAPYINHYYLLENSVQKMYDQYDVIWKKIHGGSHEWR